MAFIWGRLQGVNKKQQLKSVKIWVERRLHLLLNTGMIMLGHLNSACYLSGQNKTKQNLIRKITEFKVYSYHDTHHTTKFTRTKKKERDLESRKRSSSKKTNLNNLDFRINRQRLQSKYYKYIQVFQGKYGRNKCTWEESQLSRTERPVKFYK